MLPAPLRLNACLLFGLAALVAPARAGEPPGSSPAPTATPIAAPWFIARYVSVYTPHGMAGFAPGCPVRLIRRDEKLDRLTVTDGQYEVEVNSTQVTDDPAEAASLRAQTLAEDQAARTLATAHRPARTQFARRTNESVRAPAPPANLPVPLVFAAIPSAPAIPPVPSVLVVTPRESPPPPLTSPSPVATRRVPSLPLPAGTLFLCEYVSTQWEHGVAGFGPGQPVRLVNLDAKTGQMLVTDGRFQVEVPSAKLTSDANWAERIQRQDAAEQQSLKIVHESARVANETARRRYEAALRSIELAHDLELQSTIKNDGEVGANRLGLDPNAPAKSLYDRPYGLRGDPYSVSHTDVPRWTGPHSQPGSLKFESYGLGFY